MLSTGLAHSLIRLANDRQMYLSLERTATFARCQAHARQQANTAYMVLKVHLKILPIEWRKMHVS